MNAQALILKIRDAGFTLAADGDRLLVSPVEQLTPERLGLLREHKAEILAVLNTAGGHDLAAANCPLPARLAIAAARVCREVHGDSDDQVMQMLDDLAHCPESDWDSLADHFEGQLPPPIEPGRERITLMDDDRQFQMDVPTERVAAFVARASVKFRLLGDQGGGSLLGEPGKTEAELREILVEKYGKRLATINGEAP